MEELAGTTMGLGEFLRRSSELGRLEENLRRPDGGESPFAAVQDFLMEHLGNAQRDVTVTAAIDWLERRVGQGRISDLAHHIGLSQSALERRFRRTIGLPPKKVAAIVRLRAAIGSLSKHRDLAALAQEAGYFDQAHLSNEIRRATGVSPHRLRVSRNTSADAEFLQSLATR
jgi:transcriptional regulator GlxA family with amidase domain